MTVNPARDGALLTTAKGEASRSAADADMVLLNY